MLAILIAITLLWVLRQPMSWSLMGYFSAQIVALPVLELSWRIVGPGKAYGWVYALGTGLVLVAIGNLVRESLQTARYKARVFAVASLLALVFAKVAFLGLARPAVWADWLAIGEGGLLVAAGTVMAFSAPHSKLPDISFGLSILWLVQALSAFGWTLHWPAWNLFDLYARNLIGLAGFLFIGWRLKLRTSTTFQKAN